MIITTQDYINLILLVSAYGIIAWILLMTSAWIINRFWIDPLGKSYNRNHIIAQPITVMKNNYKEVA